MKKKFILLISILFSFFSFSITAEENSFAEKVKQQFFGPAENLFSCGVSAGVINGSIKEYVYDSTRTETNNHVSELDWDVCNIPYTDLYINFDLTKCFFFNSDFKIVLPKDSGNMQDYDWMNDYTSGNTTYWPNDDIGELTNYSIHDNYVNNWYDFSFNLGLHFYPFHNLRISPFACFEVETLQFDGNDGYSIYKWDNYVKKTFSGQVISYKLTATEVYFGLNIDLKLFRRIELFAQALCSPYLSNSTAVDTHFRTNTTFTDKIYYALRAKGTASVLYIFTPEIKAGFSGSVKYQPESYNRAKSTISDGDGGNSLFLYEMSLVFIASF